MKNTTNMGLASNEKRIQNIMRLQKAFRNQEVTTVASAVRKYGYTQHTIISWCEEGNIPLWNSETNSSVVPITVKNRPQWL